METVIRRVVSRAGLQRALAEQAVAVLLRVVRDEGEETLVERLFEVFPEASDMAEDAGVVDPDALEDEVGERDDLTEAALALTTIGVAEDDLPAVIGAFVEGIQDRLGDEETADLVESVPALSEYT